MSAETLSSTVKILDPHGMHMRPADLFVRTARKFPQCKVELVKDGQRVDGTSILEIMTLAVMYGSEVTIEVTGPDASAAMEALVQAVERGFNDPKPTA